MRRWGGIVAVRTTFGWISLVAGFALPVGVAARLGRAPGALGMQLTVLASAALVVIGAIAVWYPWIRLNSGKLARHSSFRELLRPPGANSKWVVVSTLGLLGILVSQGWAFVDHRQPGSAAMFLGSVVDAALFWSIAVVCLYQLLRIFRTPPLIAAMVAAGPYLLLIPVESLLLHFGNARFEARNLGEASMESLSAFLGTRSMSLIAISLALVASLSAALASDRGGQNVPRFLRNVSILSVAWSMPCLTATYLCLAAGRHYADYQATRELASRWRILVEHPVKRVVSELSWNSRDVGRPISASAIDVSALALEGMGIAYGRERFPIQLGVQPPKIIVLVFVESLGGCVIRRLNPGLPETLMPRLEAIARSGIFVDDYFGINWPTTPGVCSTLCSHPNYQVVERHAWLQSCASVLRDAGWDTVFLSSVSTMFDSNDRRFRRMGYDVVEGAQDWRDGPYGDLISDWGLPDRALFQMCADRIERRDRDRPLLITLLTCDTHMPDGRQNYHDFVYPDPPSWINRHPAEASWLRSFFRIDFDLGELVARLARDKSSFEDMLIVITGDHCTPLYGRFPEALGVAGPELTGRMPLLLVSGRALPPVAKGRVFSQLDLAPTLLHLTRNAIPRGYWGNSIFDSSAPASVAVSLLGNELRIIDSRGSRAISADPPADSAASRLRDYVGTFIVP